MMLLHDMSLAVLSASMTARKVSAREVTEACLERINIHDRRLNSFLLVDADGALGAADALDAERAAGQVRGPLHGIPVAIKDIIDVRGLPTTGNSRVTITECAREDAFVVAQLRKAGAVILGKTALHEFATGGPSFDLPWPPARNPWNPDHHPAGSSSGSGAAVAARMVPAALGTDTAGSVRHPATACGIVGMKPTYGAISRRGVFPLAHSLDHVGPMTRTVADNALLYDASIGYDPRDPTSSRRARPASAALLEGIAGMRIGVLEEFNRQAIPEIQDALSASLEILRGQGACLVPMSVPALEQYSDCGRLIIQAESYAVHKAWMRTRWREYGWRARTKILSGAFVDAATYIQAQQLRRELCDAFDRALLDVDAAISVSNLELPARIDDDDEIDRTYDRQARTPLNVTGNPALAVPAGLSRSGLPLGIQIIGKRFDEATVYRVAHSLEAAREDVRAAF